MCHFLVALALTSAGSPPKYRGSSTRRLLLGPSFTTVRGAPESTIMVKFVFSTSIWNWWNFPSATASKLNIVDRGLLPTSKLIRIRPQNSSAAICCSTPVYRRMPLSCLVEKINVMFSCGSTLTLGRAMYASFSRKEIWCNFSHFLPEKPVLVVSKRKNKSHTLYMLSRVKKNPTKTMWLF